MQPENGRRPAATVPTDPPTDDPAAGAASPPPPGALDSHDIRRAWPEILEGVKRASRRTRALLDSAQIADVEGNLVRLAAPGALAKMIAEESNASVLRAALTSMFGGEWRVVVDGSQSASGRGTATGGAREVARGSSGAKPAEPRGRAVEPEPDPRDEDEPPPDDMEPSGAYDSGPRPKVAVKPAPDPEAEAIRLLTTELGARPLDPS